MACDACMKKDTKRSDEDKKKLNIRINKIIGQLNGVKEMINEDRYCEDVLIQLLAIEKGVRALSNIILDEHMHSCLISHIERGDYGIIDEISDLIKRFN